jgi:hypothetical protein
MKISQRDACLSSLFRFFFTFPSHVSLFIFMLSLIDAFSCNFNDNLHDELFEISSVLTVISPANMNPLT